MLALPSMLVFIAWPLSGLTMETTQGYRHVYAAVPATMTRFHYHTFNKRGVVDALSRATRSWINRQDAKVPGADIVHTPEGFDWSQTAFLNQVPTVFPQTDIIPTIFLVAQADNPIEGNPWGLLLQYNCSIVNQVQEFQIVSKVVRPSSPYPQNPYGRREEFLEGGKSYIANLYQTSRQWVQNLDAVTDFGYYTWLGGKSTPSDTGSANYGSYLKT
jgi:hypothetical protein